MDKAEERFAWALEQRRYQFWFEDRLEEKIHVCRKRPDFYVETPSSGNFLAEVESFKQPFNGKVTGMIARDPANFRTRIHTPIVKAAAQLRPYKHLSKPMLVVLDNWRRIGMTSNIDDLWDALLFPRKGRPLLSWKDNSHLSAVAWNLPHSPSIDPLMTQPGPMFLRIIHNPYATVPFPRGAFDTEKDEHYQVRPNGRLRRF